MEHQSIADLESDEAVAIFMADAFQTNDAGFIARVDIAVRAQNACRGK
jgi:DNA-binding phage protein